MCGIFGWLGKDPKKFNKDKFDKLGIFNVERGKDSCGVSVDGDIFNGINSEKLYYNFIIERNIKPLKYPVIIGHTRQASVGNIVNIDNAHPFGFGLNQEGDGFEFIGCHNGTLYNADELAKKYEIKTYEASTYKNEFNVQITKSRSKIDSEILLEIIYKTGKYHVLSEYIGAAALLFTNTNEPGVAYVWKGASKMYNYASAKIEEERPLFYYKETKNSLYISSIKDSLLTIGGINEKNVFTFEENTLYRITDGDIDNAEIMELSRNNVSQRETTTISNTTSNAFKRYGGYENYMDDDDDYLNLANGYNELKKYTNPKLQEIADRRRNKSIKTTTVADNIYNEALIRNQNDYEGRVYYHKLRFYKNGHLITGIHTWIKGYGFYKLTEGSKEDAVEMLKRKVGKIFIDKEFLSNQDGIDITNEDISKLIPFKTDESCEHNLYYFIQGVQLHSLMDYKALYDQHKLDIYAGKMIDYIKLSEASIYPIIDMNVIHKDVKHQSITLKGKLVNKDIICPLGSERKYEILNGNLISRKINPLAEELLFGKSTDKYKTKEDLTKTEENIQLLLPINIPGKEKEIEIDEDVEVISLNELNEQHDENILQQYFEVDDMIKEMKEFEDSDKEVAEKIKKLEILKDYLSTIMVNTK